MRELFSRSKEIKRIVAIHGSVIDKDVESQIKSSFSWILEMDVLDFLCMVIRVLTEKPGLLKLIFAKK
jgi:hypothetical protein